MSFSGRFFSSVVDEFILSGGDEEAVSVFAHTDLIIVHHLLPTHLPLFRYLAKVFAQVVLIAIPYSLDLEARALLLSEGITIESPPTLSDLTNTLRRWLMDWGQNSSRKFLLFEVGGYSCDILANHTDLLKEKLDGVVEDTEHGLRLHEKHLRSGKMWWKVFTVARSPLKMAEDALTGDAVVYSLDRQIRLLHDTLNLKNVVVMGFGKIGKHVSLSLRRKKTQVFVFDIDPYKLLEAYSLGFKIIARAELLKAADIVVGATGTTSIFDRDFENLRDGVFLASASSKTIEFDLAHLKKNAIEVNKTNKWVDQYLLPTNKILFLINGGAPINFIDLAIIGSPLDLVWLECVLCLRELSEKKGPGIFELQEVLRKKLAERWINDVLILNNQPTVRD